MGEGLLLSPWSFHRSHATPEGPPCLYPFPTYVLSRCYHWLQGSFRIPKFPSLILNSSYNIATHIPKYINWPLWMVMPFGSHSMLLSPFCEPFETQVPTSLERPPPGSATMKAPLKGLTQRRVARSSLWPSFAVTHFCRWLCYCLCLSFCLGSGLRALPLFSIIPILVLRVNLPEASWNSSLITDTCSPLESAAH